MITAVLAVIVFLTAPDQIIAGYKSVNGVESITYFPKLRGVITMVLTPVLIGVMRNVAVKRNDKKIEEEPELQSLRLRGAGINLFFFIMSTGGIWVGIINIVEWIKT